MQALTEKESDSQRVGLRTVLLATDGSEDAHRALTVAADLAKRSGAAMHLVTAYELFEEDARAILDADRGRAEALDAPVSGLHASWGTVFDVVNDVADAIDADLIVVGSRNLGGLQRMLVGGISDAVVHATHRPVLIIRGGELSWPPAHVVVGFDGSAPSRRAARLAAAITHLYPRSTMMLLQVLPDPPLEASQYFTYADRVEVDLRPMQQLAEELEQAAGHTVVSTTAQGDPARALLARGAHRTGPNLVVVGTRGLGGVRRLLLGSVSTKILHSGHTPLLIVPGSPGETTEHSRAATSMADQAAQTHDELTE